MFDAPHPAPPGPPPGQGPSTRRRAAFTLLLAALGLAFVALGTWQVARRGEKLALIAAVEARVRAPPSALPAPADWPRLSPAADAYRHVAAEGRWVPGRDTLVQALTERGSGRWVLTPLRLPDGTVVLVNRGFVPAGSAAPPAGGEARVTGLLRFSEPPELFRGNDPASGRWFTRDVPAIAAARALGPTAPFFIDEDGGPDPGALPVGGLTVVAFRNEHLAYAATWFGLAIVSAAGLVLLWRKRAA